MKNQMLNCSHRLPRLIVVNDPNRKLSNEKKKHKRNTNKTIPYTLARDLFLCGGGVGGWLEFYSVGVLEFYAMNVSVFCFLSFIHYKWNKYLCNGD